MSYGTGGPSTTLGEEHDDPSRSGSDAGQAGLAGRVQGTSTEQQDSEDGRTAWQSMKHFYKRNFGLLLVFLAEVFASLVCVTEPHARHL
jgi:hypothetical protein